MPDIITCKSCNKETYIGLEICPHCDAELPFRPYIPPPTPKDEKVLLAVLQTAGKVPLILLAIGAIAGALGYEVFG